MCKPASKRTRYLEDFPISLDIRVDGTSTEGLGKSSLIQRSDVKARLLLEIKSDLDSRRLPVRRVESWWG